MVVVGKGQCALETAEYLAWHNCQVTILASSKELATDIGVFTRRHLLEWLTTDYDDLNIIHDARLEEVGEHEVIYSQGGQRIRLDGVNMVVLAIALAASGAL